MTYLDLTSLAPRRMSWIIANNENYSESKKDLIKAKNILAGNNEHIFMNSSITPIAVGEFILKTQNQSDPLFYKFNQNNYISYIRLGCFSNEFQSMLSYSLFLNIITHEGTNSIDHLFDQTGSLIPDAFKNSLENRLILDFFKKNEINPILTRLNPSSLVKNIFLDREKKEISILCDPVENNEIFKIDMNTIEKKPFCEDDDEDLNKMKHVLTPNQMYQTKQWNKLNSYLNNIITKDDLKKYEFETHVQFGQADVTYENLSSLDHRPKQERELWKETKSFVLTMLSLAIANSCSRLENPSWSEIERTKKQIRSLLENQDFLLASLNFIVERRKFIATNIKRDLYEMIPNDSAVECLREHIKVQFPNQVL